MVSSKQCTVTLLGLVLSLLVASCGSRQSFEQTIAPKQTLTPTSIPSSSITQTIIPTNIPQTPIFINHPRPDLSVTFDAFDNAGCSKDEYGFRLCANDSPLKALGCDEIQEPSSLLGGLDPSFPIAFCRVRDKPEQMNAEILAEMEKGQYFFHIPGVLASYIRYVILQDGEFRLIKCEDDFRNIYAPIETPEEALSYILAVKNLSAYFGLAYDPDYEYEDGIIEDTYVSTVQNGYKLKLFFYELFGCGFHWTYEVELQVTFDGIIQEISRRQLFRNLTEEGSCVD